MTTGQIRSASQTETVLSLRNLRVSYGEREILHGISFDVVRGETLVILGGSGSGKSTLLRTLVGLEQPSAGEIWIALFALGVSTSFTTALILESVAQAIRGALFLVPGALGVQEGGYLLVGGLLGIHGEAALALSLIRRVRELILGIPGLVAWQLIEGGRLWQAHSFPVDQDSHRFTHVPTRTCR